MDSFSLTCRLEVAAPHPSAYKASTDVTIPEKVALSASPLQGQLALSLRQIASNFEICGDRFFVPKGFFAHTQFQLLLQSHDCSGDGIGTRESNVQGDSESSCVMRTRFHCDRLWSRWGRGW